MLSISSKQHAANVIQRDKILKQIYKDFQKKPLTLRGITLLLINFRRDTRTSMQLSTILGIFEEEMDTVLKFSNAKELRNLIARSRLKYHLTAKDGNLNSQTMLLNGKILYVTPEGEIPSLELMIVDADKRISVGPLSIAFVSPPDVQFPACSN